MRQARSPSFFSKYPTPPKHDAEPLKREASALENRIVQISPEAERFVDALGEGKISLQHLEKAIASREADKQVLQAQVEDIERKLSEEYVREYNADSIRTALQGFRVAFDSLEPDEKANALRCILQDVVVYPDKIVLNVFETPEFGGSLQIRTKKLPRLDSNQRQGG